MMLCVLIHHSLIVEILLKHTGLISAGVERYLRYRKQRDAQGADNRLKVMYGRVKETIISKLKSDKSKLLSSLKEHEIKSMKEHGYLSVDRGDHRPDRTRP